MEGLASSIRGAVRMVRESCYSILWCMSRLDVHFYGLEELPGPLSTALFNDAHALSSHQMSILLNMTRYIIDDCPVPYRKHFLTPLLASLFSQVDAKVSGEWDCLLEKGQVTQGGDAQLAEEMKEESILRQLTYTAVLIVAGLLDPQRPGDANLANSTAQSQYWPASETPGTRHGGEPTMREFILSSDVVLEPLILFCLHALRMRDSRCCGIIIRVFRSIVHEFQGDRQDIREFICREVLKQAIGVSFPFLCGGHWLNFCRRSTTTTLSTSRRTSRNSLRPFVGSTRRSRRHRAKFCSVSPRSRPRRWIIASTGSQ